MGLNGVALTERTELHDDGGVGVSTANVPIAETQERLGTMQYGQNNGSTAWVRPRDADHGRGGGDEDGTIGPSDDAGEATENARAVTCRPIGKSVELPTMDSRRIDDTVRAIHSIVQEPLVIERLIVSEGIAEHQFGDRRWRETTRRVHVAITCRSMRALIDLGDFELADVRLVAGALSRAVRAEARTLTEATTHTEARIRLAPNVSAALLPALIGVAPPNIRLMQSAGGFAGKGAPIETCDIASAPNWDRPSYRVRPVRAPFSLRASCDVNQIDEDLPRAIALLAPIERLTMSVLCVRDTDVFPATVRVARIDAVSTAVRWYPYGAGSFGAEMML